MNVYQKVYEKQQKSMIHWEQVNFFLEQILLGAYKRGMEGWRFLLNLINASVKINGGGG